MMRETQFGKEEREGGFLGSSRRAVGFCSVIQSGMLSIMKGIHSGLVMGKTQKTPHLSQSLRCLPRLRDLSLGTIAPCSWPTEAHWPDVAQRLSVSEATSFSELFCSHTAKAGLLRRVREEEVGATQKPAKPKPVTVWLFCLSGKRGGVHACSRSTQKAEAGESLIRGLHSES